LKPKMMISIEFLGMQRNITKTNSIDMSIAEKTRVSDALEYVRQKYPELNLDEGMVIITVNHEIAYLNRILKANDIISFLPFISGG
jgi:molybdopterin converting factor small subunit